jgi:hypothetical protein
MCVNNAAGGCANPQYTKSINDADPVHSKAPRTLSNKIIHFDLHLKSMPANDAAK